MKPLVLPLAVALFAPLLNLASAGTDAGIQVVKSYNGYEKRQFPKKPILLCTMLDFNNWAPSEKNMQTIVDQQKSKGTIIPLGTPTIVIANVRTTSNGAYCKYVSDDFKGPFIKESTVNLKLMPQFAFYAKKVADQNPETLYAAGKDMLAVMKAVKDPKQAIEEGSMMVEITAKNEVYVGPIDINVIRRGVPTV